MEMSHWFNFPDHTFIQNKYIYKCIDEKRLWGNGLSESIEIKQGGSIQVPQLAMSGYLCI